MKQFDLRTREGKQSFYQSSEWKKLSKEKKANDPLCEEHLKKGILVPATEVHHIKDISDCPILENALNYDGLMSLCKSCHSIITSSKKKSKWEPFNINKFKSYNGNLF